MTTTQKLSITLWLTIFLMLAAMFAYSYADFISITAPPWDACGFTETKAGTAFNCIRFDTDVIIIKR